MFAPQPEISSWSKGQACVKQLARAYAAASMFMPAGLALGAGWVILWMSNGREERGGEG